MHFLEAFNNYCRTQTELLLCWYQLWWRMVLRLLNHSKPLTSDFPFPSELPKLGWRWVHEDMAREGHIHPIIKRKGKDGGKGFGLKCYGVSAMLPTGCHSFRRKRTYSGVTLTRKMRAVSQQPREEEATAHRCLVEVAELPAVLELSTQFCCLADKNTQLTADVKGGSTWKTHSRTWFSQTSGQIWRGSTAEWKFDNVDISLVPVSNHPVQGCALSNIQHLNTGKPERVLILFFLPHEQKASD